MGHALRTLFLTLIGLMWVVPCWSLEKVSLQLKWHHQFQFAGYYAAKELGYYQEAGLDVSLVPVSKVHHPIENVLNGGAQYGVGSNDLLLMRHQGKPVVVLGVIFQHSPYVMLAMQGRGIESIHDLVGKRIMLDPYATDMLAYLQSSQIPLSSLKILRANDYTPQDLISGKADAYAGYSTNDTYYLEKSGKPYLTFSPRSEGIDFYGDNLFTLQSEIDQHPERVKAFVKASLQGWQYAVDHPEKTVNLMIAAGYAKFEERDKLLYEANKTIQLMHAGVVPIGFMHAPRWQHIVETYVTQKMLPANFSLKGFLYETPAKELPDWARYLLGLLSVAALFGVIAALYFYNLKQHFFKSFFKTRSQFEKIIHRVPGLVFECTLTDRQLKEAQIDLTTVNHHFFKVVNESRQAQFWQWLQSVHPSDVDALNASFLQSARALKLWQVECRVLVSKEDLDWIHISAMPEKLADDRVVWYGLMTNITDRKNAEEAASNHAKELIFLSLHDNLTRLPNRMQMHQFLNEQLALANNQGDIVALLLLDLDQFKEINDTLGHLAGDQLIVLAAQRLTECVGNHGLVARLGGDEFVVIMHQFGSDISKIEYVAKKIVANISAPFKLDENQVYVSASIGIALFPNDGSDTHHLLKHADQAMYLAKKNGRNRYEWYIPQLNQMAEKRMHIAKDLHQAIVEQQFFLEFQPVIDFHTNQICKVEALLRWQHPVQGVIYPGVFISIAEETGMIVEIGNWVLTEVAKHLNAFRRVFGEAFVVSVNKSPVQLQNESKQSWVDLIHTLEIPANSLIVEITEGALLEDSQITKQKLAYLKSQQMQLAIDDFGTGYSSLAYIQKFDIDYIKLDKSFVQGISQSTNHLALSEAVVVMAHKLGIKVIAEGIETQMQFDSMRAVGCDFGQGFFIHRPMSAQALMALGRQSISSHDMA